MAHVVYTTETAPPTTESQPGYWSTKAAAAEDPALRREYEKRAAQASKAADPASDPAALRRTAAVLRGQGGGPRLAAELEQRARELEAAQPAPPAPDRAQLLEAAADARRQAGLHDDPRLQQHLLGVALQAETAATYGKAVAHTAPVADVADLHRRAEGLDRAANTVRGLDGEAERVLRQRAADLRRQAVEAGPK